MNAEHRAKVERLEEIKVKARKIVALHPNGLPADEDQIVTKMIEEGEKLEQEIKSEANVQRKLADLERMDDFLNNPVYKVPHGINGDTSEQKMLKDAGWEQKGGIWCAPTSQEGTRFRKLDGDWETIGKVPMYPHDVLFGAIPEDDPDTARYYRKTRAIFAPGYRDAYEKFMRTAVKYRSESMALTMMEPHEQKALSEGTDTAGGFIVPPDIQAEMLVRVPQMAIMRQFARVQPTNRDTLKWPAVKANSGTYSGIAGASIFSSGFVGSWVGETPAFNDTDASFQSLDITIKKVRVATRLSNDFISDAAVNIMAFLAQNGSENMALVEDQGFFTGDGSALVPMGLLNAGISTVSVEGSTPDTISNTSAALGSASKLIDLVYQLPPQYTPRARWVMRRTIEGKIRKLVDGNDRFMWPAYTDSAFGATPPTLMGYPVSHTDFMPDDGQDTQPVLAFGDFSHYIIGQRTQITSVVLRERFADTDQTGIILFERIGGSLYNTDAWRLGIC